jgi:hypothetical protein
VSAGPSTGQNSVVCALNSSLSVQLSSNGLQSSVGVRILNTSSLDIVVEWRRTSIQGPAMTASGSADLGDNIPAGGYALVHDYPFNYLDSESTNYLCLRDTANMIVWHVRYWITDNGEYGIVWSERIIDGLS